MIIWGIYCCIISIEWPFEKGVIVQKRFEPYREYQETTKHEVGHHESYPSTDADGDPVLKTRWVHDYNKYKLWLVKDFEDYVIIIRGEREANYIFWKQKKTYTTEYFVTPNYFENLKEDQIFSAKEYGASRNDGNNEKTLLKEWDDRHGYLFNWE